MKIVTPFLWLGGAAALFGLGVIQHSELVAVASVFAGGVGAGTLFPALKERWSSNPASSVAEPRISELEHRLRLTEDELAAASRELGQLKAARDFDLQLQLRKSGGESGL